MHRARAAIILATAILALPGCVSMTGNDLAENAILREDYLMAAVVSLARPAEDTARDQQLKPLESITFAGVDRGQVIAEIAPGDGYYTRILSQAVGPEGRVYALVPREAAGAADQLTLLAEQYGNVTLLVVEDFSAPNLPEAVDLVWNAGHYDELASTNIAAINRALRGALKPGGLYYVQDHAAPGQGMNALALGRIDPETVRAQVTDAGFRMDARSTHLANPDDPHTGHARDLDGAADRFAFRFRRN